MGLRWLRNTLKEPTRSALFYMKKFSSKNVVRTLNKSWIIEKVGDMFQKNIFQAHLLIC